MFTSDKLKEGLRPADLESRIAEFAARAISVCEAMP